jgi:hypothetical protein
MNYFPRHQIEVSGQIHGPAALTTLRETKVPINGLRGRCGRCKEDENLLPLTEFETWFLGGCPVDSLDAAPSQLCRLLENSD